MLFCCHRCKHMSADVGAEPHLWPQLCKHHFYTVSPRSLLCLSLLWILSSSTLGLHIVRNCCCCHSNKTCPRTGSTKPAVEINWGFRRGLAEITCTLNMTQLNLMHNIFKEYSPHPTHTCCKHMNNTRIWTLAFWFSGAAVTEKNRLWSREALQKNY